MLLENLGTRIVDDLTVTGNLSVNGTNNIPSPYWAAGKLMEQQNPYDINEYR